MGNVTRLPTTNRVAEFHRIREIYRQRAISILGSDCPQHKIDEVLDEIEFLLIKLAIGLHVPKEATADQYFAALNRWLADVFTHFLVLLIRTKIELDTLKGGNHAA